MEYLPQEWSDLVAPFTLVLSTGLVYLLYHFSRQLERTRGELTRLKNEYLALASGNIGIGKKLLKIEGLIASFRRGRKQQPVSKHNKKLGAKKQQAKKQKTDAGTKRMEDPASCGFSQAEADLLRLMQSSNQHLRH